METEARKVHFNWPQRRGALVRAQKEVLVASRGFGKTTGVFSERVSHNSYAMPRGLGALVMPSYKKFLTQFVSNFIKGLSQLGYTNEVFYTIGERGPRSWPLPYTCPQEWDHAIHWSCGSGTVFISQDGKGAGNGFDLDWVAVDEAKLCSGPKFESDTLPALRGNLIHFSQLSEHYSVFICSDRPRTREEKWFYKYRDLYTPDMRERVQCILQLQLANERLLERIASGALSPSSQAKYESDIRKHNNLCTELRKKLIYYHEGSILDNIHAIGLEKLAESDVGLSFNTWRAAVLNEDIDQVEGGFYPGFVRDIHTYSPDVSSYTTARGADTDRLSSVTCLHDKEISPDLPLEISGDYGGKMNCLVVGQRFRDMLRVDNALHVLHPLQTVDVAKKFCEYYSAHRRKEVTFYHDHTARMTTGQGPNYRDIIVTELRRNGWVVHLNYIGQQPSPRDRYEWWGRIFRLRGSEMVITINADNCSDLVTAIGLCELEDTDTGIRKRKSVEKGPIEDQVHAPHLTDALDTLAWGVFHSKAEHRSTGAVSWFA